LGARGRRFESGQPDRITPGQVLDHRDQAACAVVTRDEMSGVLTQHCPVRESLRAVDVAGRGVRTDLRRVRLYLASTQIGSAAAIPVDLRVLRGVGRENHRPCRTAEGDQLDLGAEPVRRDLPALSQMRRRPFHAAPVAPHGPRPVIILVRSGGPGLSRPRGSSADAGRGGPAGRAGSAPSPGTRPPGTPAARPAPAAEPPARRRGGTGFRCA